MLNLISFLIGLVALIVAIPLALPVLGIANWLLLPFALIGVVIGAISSSNGGRNFCLIVSLLIMFRLFIGGGIL